MSKATEFPRLECPDLHDNVNPDGRTRNCPIGCSGEGEGPDIPGFVKNIRIPTGDPLEFQTLISLASGTTRPNSAQTTNGQSSKANRPRRPRLRLSRSSINKASLDGS